MALADIVVVAVGKPGILRGEWIKPGAVVIDVGINRMPDGKLVGDVEFEAATSTRVVDHTGAGWRRPMTVAILMKNTLESAQQRFAEKPHTHV